MAMIKLHVDTKAGGKPEVDTSDILMFHPGDRLLFSADNKKEVLINLNGTASGSTLLALARWIEPPEFKIEILSKHVIVKLLDSAKDERDYQYHTYRKLPSTFTVDLGATPPTVTALDTYSEPLSDIITELHPWDQFVFRCTDSSKTVLVNFGGEAKRSPLIAAVREITAPKFITESLSDGRSVLTLTKGIGGLNGPSPDWPW